MEIDAFQAKGLRLGLLIAVESRPAVSVILVDAAGGLVTLGTIEGGSAHTLGLAN